jgi:2-haloacid dehalogenase
MMMTVPRVIAFDVNETLLDLAPLDPVFDRAFGNAALRGQWFAQMLQLAFVGGLTGRYVDFPSAQRAALSMLADTYGVALEDDIAETLAARMRGLPPHPDVAGALKRLREARLPLAALTNSPLEVAREQLGHADLADRFDAILSADQVRALKPRPEPYHLVADTFGVPPDGVRLVAAHAWDVAGALAAGCAAAFVRRPGKVLSPLGDQPDIVGEDLVEVADRIIAIDGARVGTDNDSRESP